MRGDKKQKKRSVTVKLVGTIVPIVVLVIAMIVLTVYTSTSKSILKKSETQLQTATGKAIQETKAWMNKTLTSLETQRDVIQFYNMDVDEMKQYISHTADQSDAYPAGIYIALTSGELYHSSFVPDESFNLYEKPWYKDGLESEEFILGDVYFDEDSQSSVVGASGVLKDASGNVRGVAAADVYLDSISDIVRQTQLEKTGGIFLVDTRTDTIIGHKDESITGKKMSEIDGGIYRYVEDLIHERKTGLTTYENKSEEDTYIELSKVPDSDWVAVTYVPKAEVLQDLNSLTRIMIVIAAAAILILIAFMMLLIRKIIGKPVHELNNVANRIAEGDLNQSIQYCSNDELGQLAGNFNKTTDRLKGYVVYIDEIAKALTEIAHGNLCFTLKQEYAGEFEKIKDSLNEISYSLNSTIGQIQTASKEVLSGAEQVSDGAQTLSQGSTEQASSIEELAATINEVSTQIQHNAQNAQSASQVARDVGDKILDSNNKMQNMAEAIQKISNKSEEIHKIIKTIEDIAFQTNILALNAAVEAARAGEAGKGFAVVADEVRNLAGKSSEAAKETTTLIDQTVQAVEEGTYIATDAAKSMLEIVDKAKTVTEYIGNIAEHSEQQAVSANEITQGVEQISSVVQTNSATAQQSAAASEQLSGQANILEELAAKFKLKS